MARQKGRYNALTDANTKVVTGAGALSAGGVRTDTASYSAALYARISAEHRDRESDSLENQLLVLEDFVKGRPEFAHYRIFSDRNYSGTNFNRPAFQEMMQEVREGRINCIIVKDLSRLGRDYLEAGNYIETIFPFLGVRFIAINDHFDTVEEENGNRAMMISIKNLVNDMYARDISRKMSGTVRDCIRRGSYVGSNAPYGYHVIKNDIGYGFEIDEETSKIVVWMYERYLELGNLHELAREMTQKRIRTPGDYLITQKVYLEEDEPVKLWLEGTIHDILTREAYLGHMVQGKTIQHRFEGISQKHLDKEEWIKVENTHEPIVTVELFEAVAEELARHSRRITSRTDEVPMDEDIFDGILYCPVCGNKVRQVSSLKKNGSIRHYYYYCNHSTVPDKKGLENCIIKREELRSAATQAVMEAVREISVDKGILMDKLTEKQELLVSQYEASKGKLADKIRKLEGENVNLYGDYVIGKLPREDFKVYNEQSEAKIAGLKAEISLLQEEEQSKLLELKKLRKWIESFLRFEEMKELNRELVLALIERIELYPGRKLVITFPFMGQIKAVGNRDTHEITITEGVVSNG